MRLDHRPPAFDPARIFWHALALAVTLIVGLVIATSAVGVFYLLAWLAVQH